MYTHRLPGARPSDGASTEIARAVQFFNRRNVDVLILARGGGSLEILASTKKKSPAPSPPPNSIISGVATKRTSPLRIRSGRPRLDSLAAANSSCKPPRIRQAHRDLRSALVEQFAIAFSFSTAVCTRTPRAAASAVR